MNETTAPAIGQEQPARSAAPDIVSGEAAVQTLLQLHEQCKEKLQSAARERESALKQAEKEKEKAAAEAEAVYRRSVEHAELARDAALWEHESLRNQKVAEEDRRIQAINLRWAENNAQYKKQCEAIDSEKRKKRLALNTTLGGLQKLEREVSTLNNFERAEKYYKSHDESFDVHFYQKQDKTLSEFYEQACREAKKLIEVDSRFLKQDLARIYARDLYAMFKAAQTIFDRDLAIIENEADEQTRSLNDANIKLEEHFLKDIEKCTNAQESYEAAKNKSDEETKTAFTRAKGKAEDTRRQGISKADAEKNRAERQAEFAYDAAVQQAETALFEEAERLVPKESFRSWFRERENGEKRLMGSAYQPPEEDAAILPAGRLHYPLKDTETAFLRLLSTHYPNAYDEKRGEILIPCELPVNKDLRLMFKYDQEKTEEARAVIQNLCLNALLSMPPQGLRLCCIDPVSNGRTFSLFGNFEDQKEDYQIIQGRTRIEKKEIEELLDQIRAQILSVGAAFKNRYDDIRDYNREHPINPQRYTILAIMDYPHQFSEDALDKLQNIIAGGSAFGVYPVIMANETRLKAAMEDPRMAKKLREVEALVQVYRQKDGKYYREMRKGEQFQLDQSRYYEPFAGNRMPQVLEIYKKVQQGAKDVGSRPLAFSAIMPPAEQRFRASIDDGVVVPIGMDDASEMQYLTFGKDDSRFHAIIAGDIGTGKSRLLHNIITGCLLRYSSEELEFYLVDFKKGNEFSIYPNYNLPGIRLVAMEASPEFGLSVLQRIKEKIITPRQNLFNEIENVTDLPSYNRKAAETGRQRLSRIVLIIDEFHYLFSSRDESVNKEAGKLLSEMLRMDRTAGINIILASQSPGGSEDYITEEAFQQIATRISFQIAPKDADTMFVAGASEARNILAGAKKGEAVFCPKVAESAKKIYKFRAALITAEEHPNILREIGQHYDGLGVQANPSVFTKQVSYTRRNVYQQFFRDNILPRPNGPVHTGIALSLDEEFRIDFQRRDKNHLLIAGLASRKGQSLLLFMLMDLALQKISARQEGLPEDQMFFLHCDPDDAGKNPLTDAAATLMDLIELGDASDADEFLERIEELAQRRDRGRIWLFLDGLEHAEQLQYGAPQGFDGPYDRFLRLLQSGAQNGVHVVAWTRSIRSMAKRFPGGGTYRDALESFGKRMAFELSTSEMKDFIQWDAREKSGADKEKPDQPVYYFEEGHSIQSIYPFSIEENEEAKWIRTMCARIEETYLELE